MTGVVARRPGGRRRIGGVLAVFVVAGCSVGPVPSGSGAGSAGAPTTPIATPQPSVPAPSPTSQIAGLAGRIAFSVEFGPAGCAQRNACDAYGDIYTIRPDGSGIAQLTHVTDSFAGSPTWSPSGDRLYYLERGHVFSMDPSGADVRQLTTGHGWADKQLAVSPDGSLLAFGWHDRGHQHPRLALMRTDGTGFKWLTRAPTAGDGDGHPTFSPDGRRIAFWRTGAIEIINVDGTGLRELAPAPTGDDFHPQWSPDGTSLLFATETGMHLVNVDGSGMQDLGMGSDPDWSPDGAWIVYHRWVGQPYISLFVRPVNGADSVEIWHTTPETDTFIVQPDWGAAP